VSASRSPYSVSCLPAQCICFSRRLGHYANNLDGRVDTASELRKLSTMGTCATSEYAAENVRMFPRPSRAIGRCLVVVTDYDTCWHRKPTGCG